MYRLGGFKLIIGFEGSGSFPGTHQEPSIEGSGRINLRDFLYVCDIRFHNKSDIAVFKSCDYFFPGYIQNRFALAGYQVTENQEDKGNEYAPTVWEEYGWLFLK